MYATRYNSCAYDPSAGPPAVNLLHPRGPGPNQPLRNSNLYIRKDLARLHQSRALIHTTSRAASSHILTLDAVSPCSGSSRTDVLLSHDARPRAPLHRIFDRKRSCLHERPPHPESDGCSDGCERDLVHSPGPPWAFGEDPAGLRCICRCLWGWERGEGVDVCSAGVSDADDGVADADGRCYSAVCPVGLFSLPLMVRRRVRFFRPSSKRAVHHPARLSNVTIAHMYTLTRSPHHRYGTTVHRPSA
ncbi:hypothetical protein DENSPDRAFT_353655 [Dentipellis sp. KUC8613]|nr:hypothetical protein DENSPDRAFT_353655 [Dentipellis sp. KUC8613]